jgi:hypothetical protein
MHVLIKFNLGLIDVDRELRAAEADLILSRQQAGKALDIGKTRVEQIAGSKKALITSFVTGLTIGLLPLPRSKKSSSKSSITPLLTPLISMGVQLAMQNLPVVLNQLRREPPPPPSAPTTSPPPPPPPSSPGPVTGSRHASG